MAAACRCRVVHGSEIMAPRQRPEPKAARLPPQAAARTWLGRKSRRQVRSPGGQVITVGSLRPVRVSISATWRAIEINSDKAFSVD
jgi:hypothetical protein